MIGFPRSASSFIGCVTPRPTSGSPSRIRARPKPTKESVAPPFAVPLVQALDQAQGAKAQSASDCSEYERHTDHG